MLRWLARIALLLALLAAIASAAAWWLLRGSLPALDGEAALPGLSAPVAIARDALGVVTIDAGSEIDAMRALGYVHAQERYFEMDLLRRSAAGELSALFGEVALDTDRGRRVHRLRARVEAGFDEIAGDSRPLLQAYADGVNAGLASLRVRPWPYLLLAQQPEPWRPADSILAGYAMYFDLQDADNARELALWRIRPHLPPALFALLTHGGSDWDAPLVGEAIGDAALPPADAVDLRRLPAPEGDRPARLADRGTPGSNSFAVSGARTADGRALVANDMHLGLRAPNIWFRARLRHPDPRAADGRVDIAGFTLPGLPAVIVGSNGRVAWGFTNSYGDYADWALETPCENAAAAGCATVERHVETIVVAGGEPVRMEVEETAWGPVLYREDDGRVLSLRWAAHQPASANLGLAELAVAHDLDDALAIAGRIAIPTQNLLIADAHGRIAWRLLGPVAMRDEGEGCPQRLPQACDLPVSVEPGLLGCPSQTGLGSGSSGASSAPQEAGHTPPSAAACAPWPIATDRSPVLVDPPDGRLWTANNRLIDGAALALVGDGGYALGARAQQIRDALQARERFDEADLLAIQLDDRALLLAHWQQLLRDGAAAAGTPALQALSAAAADWQGRASPESAGYRLVRAWRLAVLARIADGLTAPAQAALGDDFVMPDLPQLEGLVWPLVTQRPPHLLSRRYADWNALFEDAAQEVVDELGRRGPLAERTWGERNTARICHPLAGAIPLLGRRLLCMPAEALPGDGMMPRVQGPSFGASERMVVAPGREADGIVHMPGGQSGHRLSPFWGAGHDDWVQGRPTAFLPGESRHTLTLRPSLPREAGQ